MSQFTHNIVKDPRLGTASNVWQIGMIMYVLMRRSHERMPNWGGRGDYHQDRTKLMCYQSTMTPRLRNGGSTIGCSRDYDAEKNPLDSMYSRELRSIIHECILVSPASRIPAAELVERTGKNLTALNMTKAKANGPFEDYEEPQLSQRWYSGQLNGNPANAAPVPVANPAAQPFDAQGRPKPSLNAGAAPGFAPQIFNAAAGGFVPQLLARPDPNAPISSGIMISSPNANPALPGPNPDSPDANYPVPDPLVVIVLHRPTFLAFGQMKHATYRLTGLTSASTVQDINEQLIYRGVKEPFTLMHGRQTMTKFMKLGEFKDLQNIRATEL